jgi:subtilisin family serine protease
MNILRLLFLLWLVMVSSTVHSDGFKVTANEMSTVLNPAMAERLLLIGFPDQSINRVQSASSGAYRQRGSYQSSIWSERIADAIAQDYPIAKLTEWPMSVVGVHCVVYQVLGNASVETTIAQLSKDPRVRIVQNMHIFKTKAHQYNDPYFKLQANLQQMAIGLAHSKRTGKTTPIAMIDPGVDLDHPELAGQISASENFASQISASFANDKHGTAVAGIMVARSDNGTGIIGIAPDAKLIALKACWPDQADAMAAVCNSFTLALAVNKAIQSGAKILNMSLTGPKDAFLELLLNKAIEDGMIVVAADAGEQNAQENFPASLKNVISVQSLKPIGQIPPLLSITAPGEKILTTLPHGTYDFISGNSIAAAEVSGIVALLMELKPDLDINQVLAILQTSKLPNAETAFSGINANTAVLKLCSTTNCPKTF